MKKVLNKNKKINGQFLKAFLAVLFLVLGLGKVSLAQVVSSDPHQINISAYIVNQANQEIVNGDYSVRFAIYAKDRTTADPYPSNADAKVWEETQTVKLRNGFLEAYVGAANPFPATLNFTTGSYYLGIRINTDSEMVPRKRIGATPLAFNSFQLQGSEIGTKEGNIPLLGKGGLLDVKMMPAVTDLGTISNGVWEGDPIADNFIENALTGKTYNGLTLTSNADGFSVAGGVISRTLTVLGGNVTLQPPGAAGTVMYSNGTAYSFSAQGSTGQVLLSSGAGTPVWGTVTGGAGGIITADSLDFTELADALTLDDNLTIDTDGHDFIVDGTLQANSIIISGEATIGTLGLNLYTNTSFIPSTTGLNLGSASNHWANLYVDNLSAGGMDINGTSSEYFSINTDSVSDEDMGVRFYRSALNGYAALTWNATLSQFDLFRRENTGEMGSLNLDSLYATGNVGIGTTDPVAKLQVIGGFRAEGGDFYLDNGNLTGISGSGQSLELGGQYSQVIMYDSFRPENDLSFGLGQSAYRFSNLYTKNITDNGIGVGIGTASPSGLLHLKGVSDLTTLIVQEAAAFVPPSNPAELLGLKAWYKADVIEASDNDPVSVWEDYSGHGNNLAQIDAGSQPLFKTNVINSQPVVRFDGTDDSIAAAFDSGQVQPYTMFVVSKFNSVCTTQEGVLDGGSNTSAYLFRNSGENNGMYFNDGGQVGPAVGATDQKHVYTIVANATASSISVDGDSSVAMGELSGTPLSGLYLGGRNSSSEFGDVDIAEVVIYNGTLRQSEIAAIEAYLGNKYAITITNPASVEAVALQEWLNAGGDTLAVMTSSGNLGIGLTAPTAYLQIKAGTTAPSSAPLKFTAGANLTTAEAGAMEWDGVNLFITQTTGPTRKTLAYLDSTLTGTFDGLNFNTGNQGGIPYYSATDTLTSSAAGIAGQALISGGTGSPTWFAPTSGSILFAGTGGILEQDNANFFWENTLNYLQLGNGTANKFSFGLDSGDSDKFKIYSGSGIAGTSEFSIDTDGLVSISNLELGAQVFADDSGAISWIDMGVVSALDNTVESYTAQLDGNAMLTISGLSDGAGGVDNLQVLFPNGNVGIGTTDPVYNLQVAGTLGIGGTAYFAGNVGIGTIDPQAKLNILLQGEHSSFGQEALRISAGHGVEGSGGKIVFADDDNLTLSAAIQSYTFGPGATGLAFATGYGAVATRMVIDNDGNVGIGTTNPGYNLDIAGTLGVGGTAYFAGNVGIGTTSPSGLLHLQGNLDETTFIVQGGGLILSPGSPTDIIGLKAWYRADAIVASDNDPVSTWTDSSGNGNSLTQITAGSQPLYKANIMNSNPVVRFDGVDDNIAVAFGASQSQPYTMFVVSKFNSAYDTQEGVLDGGSNLSAYLFRSGNNNDMYFNDGAQTGPSSGATNEKHVYTLVVGNVASNSIRIDGKIPPVAGTTAGTPLSGLFLGGGYNSEFGDSDIAEVIIYNGALSQEDIAIVESYLGIKYAVIMESSLCYPQTTALQKWLNPGGSLLASMSAYGVLTVKSIDIANSADDGDGLVSALNISADYSLLNTAGDGYTGISLNVLGAGAGANGAQNLLDLKRDGNSKFTVNKAGALYIPDSSTEVTKLMIGATAPFYSNGDIVYVEKNLADQLLVTLRNTYTGESDAGSQFTVINDAGNTGGIGISNSGWNQLADGVSAHEVFVGSFGSDNSNLVLLTQHANTKIRFAINSVEKMRLDNSGLGLGTTAPTGLLDVAGGVKIGATYAGMGTTAPSSGLLVQGNVGIGATNPDAKLKVVGSICATATDTACFGTAPGYIYADNFIAGGTALNIPDYVFEADYNLMPLDQLAAYISEHKHLPGVPSASDIEKNGLNLTQMVPAILEKTEENTLYILGLDLKTDQNITTLQELQTSVDEQLGVVESGIKKQESRIDDADNIMKQVQSDNLAQDNLITLLQGQMAQLQADNGTNLSNILQNTTDIGILTAQVESILGADPESIATRLANLETLSLFSSRNLENGGLEITIADPLAKTIGESVIPANASAQFVGTKAVTVDSKIYITPIGSTDNQVIYVGALDAANGFEVKVDRLETVLIPKEIKFDWWIVESKNLE